MTSARNHVKTIPKPIADGHALQNRILLDLPSGEHDAVFGKLRFVQLPTHTVLNETGAPIRFAYFINSGLASVLNVMTNGKSVEVGLSGKEGFVGIPLIAGFISSPSRIIMQVGGAGYKIRPKEIRDLLRQCPKLERKLQRYSQEIGMQGAQVAACNRLHEVDERLARWLLMSQDRIGGDIVPLTQQYLAHMLGTRRASVSVAAGVLQKAKLITYTRGIVTIKNRRKLENAACECYAKMNRQSHRWSNESQ